MNLPPATLAVCTGNSCRNIITKALLTHHGGARISACSAGSHPTGYVRPQALEVLPERRISLADPRSKSWTEFDGPPPDVLLTVCDSTANEPCPCMPGDIATRTHWDVPDPAAFRVNQMRNATAQCAQRHSRESERGETRGRGKSDGKLINTAPVANLSVHRTAWQ